MVRTLLAWTMAAAVAACDAGTITWPSGPPVASEDGGPRGDAAPPHGDPSASGDDATSGGDATRPGGDFGELNPLTPIDIVAGGYHTCVLHLNGTVSCWGRRLPASSTFGDRTRPVPVEGVSNIKQVATGYEFSCGLDDLGTVHCWGSNGGGQLGDGTRSGGPNPRPTEYTGVKALPDGTLGHFHSTAIFNDGSLAAAGYNNEGQLGIGSKDTSPVPHENPTALPNIIDATHASLGHFHGCALVGETDQLWCWGYNGWGELGNGGIDPANEPIEIALSGIDQLALGHQHSCALMSDRTVRCWGNNSSGSLGTGEPSGVKVPTAVPNLTDIVELSANFRHVCAIDGTGKLYCWGDNDHGQLGAVSGDQRSPVHIDAVSGVRHVAVGLGHTCVLLADDSVQCWGYNSNGQLGNGLLEDSTSPVRAQLLTACGDGTCDAAAYELCGNCPQDCDTPSEICGNGECQGSETHDSCPSDCPPDTWPTEWETLEDAVFDLINQKRTAGGSCSTSGAKPAVPALTEASLLRQAARAHAWDMSYANYSSHDSCNGRRPADRAAALSTPYRSENLASWIETAESVVDAWMASTTGHCDNIMDAGATKLGVGYAKYATTRWVLMFE